MPIHDPWQMRDALRADLVAAKKARHVDAVAALRTTLAAIDERSAEGACPTEPEPAALTVGVVLDIVRTQISDRITRAERYEARERRAAADRLRREAEILVEYARAWHQTRPIPRSAQRAPARSPAYRHGDSGARRPVSLPHRRKELPMADDKLSDEIDDAAGKDESRPTDDAEDTGNEAKDVVDTDRPPPGNLGPGTPS